MKAAPLATLALAVVSLNIAAQQPRYAPTPPPIIYNDAKPKALGESSAPIAQAVTQYNIGDPTDEEQMHLELINRARKDANAEALRLIALAATDPDVAIGFQNSFWTVNTNLMKAQFSTNPPVGPVSMNAKLTAAARGHSQYMLDNAIQDHTGAGGSTPTSRITASGYQFSALGENVYLNAQSVEDGHAGFDVDWGFGPGGMQSPPGHRNTIHNGNFYEVGIGVIKGSHTNETTQKVGGPHVVTEDFAAPFAGTRFITGVAYYDINRNNFYDLGEGLPGVRVTVDGISTFAITTTSGGYSIPIPPNTSRVVRFEANGYPDSYFNIVGPSPNNIKADFRPTYVVPIVSGPSTAYQGIENVYNVAPLPGATGYRARLTRIAPTAQEGAEGVLARVTITTTGDYPFVSTTRKASGSKSFHLGHADLPTIDPQIILFDEEVFILPDARMDFKSLLAFAGEGEVAKFEVSTDNGGAWTTLWSQAGDQSEETVFSAKSASLAAYANKNIRVRFVFDYTGDNLPAAVLPDSTDPAFDHIGWFLDDITFVNTQTRLTSVESNILAVPRAVLGPGPEVGTYLLEFQSIVGARTFEYGPPKQIMVRANPPSVSLLNNVSVTDTTISMIFGVDSGTATTFVLESTASVNGPWSRENQAQIDFSAPGAGRFTVTTPRNGPVRFYRLTAE